MAPAWKHLHLCFYTQSFCCFLHFIVRLYLQSAYYLFFYVAVGANAFLMPTFMFFALFVDLIHVQKLHQRLIFDL